MFPIRSEKFLFRVFHLFRSELVFLLNCGSARRMKTAQQADEKNEKQADEKNEKLMTSSASLAGIM